MADPTITRDGNAKDESRKYEDAAAIERVPSTYADEKDHADYGRMDRELAKYAEGAAIEISPEESKRLKNMIDRRVLVCMVVTYFLQV